MAIVETYESTMSRLPPGPWHASGVRVMSGAHCIAVVMDGRGAETLAQELARLPEYLQLATTAQSAALAVQESEEYQREAEKLVGEVDDLQASKDELEMKVADLQDEVESLKATVGVLQARLADFSRV